MLIDQSPKLKEAVLNMSAKEKDKLLLKLISKDVVLLSQLEHKLLEDESDIDSRVEIIKSQIEKGIAYANGLVRNGYSYSPGYFMMEIRGLNGLINEHLLITKHKISEVDLRIYLLECVIECDAKYYFDKKSKSVEKLFAYFASRIKYVVDKHSKLHEDIQFDFSERLNFILNFASAKHIDYNI